MKGTTLYDGNHTLTFEDLWKQSPEDMQVFVELTQKEGTFFSSHLLIIQHLLESGIQAVVDIDCGSGSQGYLFRAAGIRYVGIERYEKNLWFGELQLPDGSIIVKQGSWPCRIPETKGISTCISAYALGILGEENLASVSLAAMKRRFKRAYILAFPHVQATAQQIWGATTQWVRPYEPGDQWLQICEKRSFFRAFLQQKL